MYEIKYEFREQDLIHFNESRFHKSKELRRKSLRSRLIVPAVLGIVGIYYWTYLGDMTTGAYIIILALGLAATSPMVIKWDLRRQILTSYSNKEKVAMFGLYTLRIDPNQLFERSPSGKNKMPWGELLRIEETEDYAYIYVDIDTALIIPKETIVEGKLEEFIDQAEKMIERFDK